MSQEQLKDEVYIRFIHQQVEGFMAESRIAGVTLTLEELEQKCILPYPYKGVVIEILNDLNYFKN